MNPSRLLYFASGFTLGIGFMLALQSLNFLAGWCVIAGLITTFVGNACDVQEVAE